MSSFGQVVKQAVPIITLEVLVPWMWERVFYSNTTLDFAAWLLSVAFLDSAFPGSVPCFRSTRVWERLWDILRLIFLWMGFRVGLYAMHNVMMFMVKDYSKILCSVGLCWLRLVAPLAAILLFTAYLYFATERKRKTEVAEELEMKLALERAKEAAEMPILPVSGRNRSPRVNSSRQRVSRSSSATSARVNTSSRRSPAKKTLRYSRDSEDY